MLVLQQLKQPYQVNFSGNPIVYSFALAPYGLVEKKQDIKIAITIEKENAGNYAEIKTDILYPDTAGVINFSISAIVDAWLKFYTPRYTQVTPQKIEGQSGRFRVKVLIQKDGVLLGAVLTTDTITVLKGGLTYEQQSVKEFFEQKIVMMQTALHYYSEPQTITPHERKYLTWLFYKDMPTSQTLVFTFFKDDNTILTHQVPVAYFTEKWSIYQANISIISIITHAPVETVFINKLTIGLQNASIYKMSVSVIEPITNEIFVQPVFYEIDYRNYFSAQNQHAIADRDNNDYGRLLLYSNSVGGLETLNVLGEIEMQAEYASNNAQVVAPPGGIRNAVLAPQLVSNEILETEKFVGSTGFITEKFLNNLRDLLLSRNTYEVKNGKFIPININKKTVKFYSNRDSLYSMALEWQHAFTNNYYSPGNIIAGVSICPALDFLHVLQVAKDKLQIMWAMPEPYDLLHIEITSGVGSISNATPIILNGNSGSKIVPFFNPAVAGETANITINGSVICNPDSVPVNYGPQTTVTVVAFANLLPVANPDTFAIAAGYNTPQVLPGSVLDNDYDLDNDDIQVRVTAGLTSAGGNYSITAAGIVTYLPPTSVYNGVDTFTYILEEVATPAAYATALVNINVGNIGVGNGFYVKILSRNRVETGSMATQNLYVSEQLLLGFFADPAGTIPRDATGLGITINLLHRVILRRYNNGAVILNVTGNLSHPALGTEVIIFNGFTTSTGYVQGSAVYESIIYTILPGAGYIPV